MRNRIDIAVLGRRTFVVAGAAAVAFASHLAGAEEGGSGALERSQGFKDDLARILAGAAPVEGKIMVDLPATADNGNFVPITILVDNPMTEADYVKSIHILSTANPHAHVATFHLSPANAVARVQGRMRLAKTQDVIVLAELSGGAMLAATTRVKVLIGGCGI